MAINALRPAIRPKMSAISGDDPVLAWKITVPGVTEWALPRARITHLIDEGTRCCPLTVVTGPAGAGKTMALALWAAGTEPGTVAWLSLDECTERPSVFWSHVVAALRRSGIALPRALLREARGRAPGHAFMMRLASALAAHEPAVVLVLDDFPRLAAPNVLNGLDFLLRNTGPGLRIVVSSRADPPLPLYRYRVADQLAEIRAGDLAFTVAETAELMTQHGTSLSADSLNCLTDRTEGWAAGLRLAAISMETHPDPDRFVKELTSCDNALTGYLVEEVLSAQRPKVRDVLLSTSILEQVEPQLASDLTGDEQAAGILAELAQANAFVQSIEGGRYRYHTLFGEVLRLKLRHEHPDRVPPLHVRAARWYERNGRLTEAVRHSAEAGDWQLAAGLVVDNLAISEILEPRGDEPLADAFECMPQDVAWARPEPYLVAAAVGLAAGRQEASTVALDAAEDILVRAPADEASACRFAVSLIHLAAARRTGDVGAAAEAADRVEELVDELSAHGHADRAQAQAETLVRYVRGTVELWTGHLDQAARAFDSAVTASDAGGEHLRADCLGGLALVEALRGRLRHAGRLASRPTTVPAGGEQTSPTRQPTPSALLALACVHLEQNELGKARSRLKQAEAALVASPDKLLGALARGLCARIGLAEGRPDVAIQSVTKARSGWPVPGWLDGHLTVTEARACVEAGDIRTALAAAERAGHSDSPEAAVALAHVWVAAGRSGMARPVLDHALADLDRAPDPVRVQTLLVDARLSYGNGDRARGDRSLASALRLAEREQLRLPIVMERSWIGPALQRDPGLAGTWTPHVPARTHDGVQARPSVQEQQAAPAVIEPLTEREREVLQHFAGMLNTAEVAAEMYISVNTVKSHLKSIYRKLGAGRIGEAVRRARRLELI